MSPNTSPDIPADAPAAFEEQIARLREISGQLEQGGLSLEKSLELYKEGVALTARCRKQLDNARHLVRIYTEEGLDDFVGLDADDKDGGHDF